MSKDPRKRSAYDSGMRGNEKPKVSGDGGGGNTKVNDNAGGESKQAAGKTIGTPGGVDLSAYKSGMRGIEQPKQKSAKGGATYGQGNEGSGGGENKQGPNKHVGNPDGHSDAKQGARKGVTDSHLQSAAKDAKKLGIPGNNTEASANGDEPWAEEDDTHINIKIPKASMKRKTSGMAGSI
jgi:hypothetical protein